MVQELALALGKLGEARVGPWKRLVWRRLAGWVMLREPAQETPGLGLEQAIEQELCFFGTQREVESLGKPSGSSGRAGCRTIAGWTAMRSPSSVACAFVERL